jgi:hypothetical protein
MNEPVRIVAVFASAILGILIFSAVQAITGHHGASAWRNCFRS